MKFEVDKESALVRDSVPSCSVIVTAKTGIRSSNNEDLDLLEMCEKLMKKMKCGVFGKVSGMKELHCLESLD